jgi:hypothetical protein
MQIFGEKQYFLDKHLLNRRTIRLSAMTKQILFILWDLGYVATCGHFMRSFRGHKCIKDKNETNGSQCFYTGKAA